MANEMWWSLLAAAETDSPSHGASTGDTVMWWIGGIIVAVIFGAIVLRTLRRNRLRK